MSVFINSPDLELSSVGYWICIVLFIVAVLYVAVCVLVVHVVLCSVSAMCRINV